MGAPSWVLPDTDTRAQQPRFTGLRRQSFSRAPAEMLSTFSILGGGATSVARGVPNKSLTGETYTPLEIRYDALTGAGASDSRALMISADPTRVGARMLVLLMPVLMFR